MQTKNIKVNIHAHAFKRNLRTSPFLFIYVTIIWNYYYTNYMKLLYEKIKIILDFN